MSSKLDSSKQKRFDWHLFWRDVSQNFSVLANPAEITPDQTPNLVKFAKLSQIIKKKL